MTRTRDSNHRKKTVPTLTVDTEEVAHFSKYASEWWAPHGPYAPLHMMIRPRMEYITQICAQYGLETAKKSETNLKNKDILDVGCGGGLLSESLSRIGANVTGIDADTEAIMVAQNHAASQDLNITYEAIALETKVTHGKKFDVITALEIVEHVSDPDAFISHCSECLTSGGLLILSTLNRTWKSYILGILAAERVLSWAPLGTHDWNKFLKPSELARLITAHGLDVVDARGLVYHPLEGQFRLAAHDLDINYFITARKPT